MIFRQADGKRLPGMGRTPLGQASRRCERPRADPGYLIREGRSDWKDVPSPLIDGFDKQVVPTLESHILVEETSKGRLCVTNPYFHMVDTSGQQLPYINELDERYVPDKEVHNLKITNGEVDYKQQAVFIEDFPLYKENEKNGNFTVDLSPGLGQNVFYSFNTTHKDAYMRQVFNDVRFLKAMSLARNREVVKTHLKNLWKIGTVGGILSPIVHHNRVGNFIKMTAKTYDYYWAYPYRPQQWYIK